jgi:hypothetical protein
MRPCCLKQKVYLTEPPPTSRSANHDEQRTAPGAVGRAGKSAEGASLHSSAVLLLQEGCRPRRGLAARRQKDCSLRFPEAFALACPVLGSISRERHRRTQDSTPDAAERRARQRTRGRHRQGRQGIDDLREDARADGLLKPRHGMALHDTHGMAWHGIVNRGWPLDWG